MEDQAEGGLIIDVRELDLSELRDDWSIPDSALDYHLDSLERGSYEFNSAI